MTKPKMNKIFLLILTTAIILALLLAACNDSAPVLKAGGSSGQETGVKAPEGEGRQEASGQPSEDSQETAVKAPEGGERQEASGQPSEDGQETGVKAPEGGGRQEASGQPSEDGQETGVKAPEGEGRQEASGQPSEDSQETAVKAPEGGGRQEASGQPSEDGQSSGGSTIEARDDKEAASGENEKTETEPETAQKAETKEATIETEIVKEPKDADVKEGQDAVFTVDAKGSGLKYLWEKKGALENEWKSSVADGHRTAVLTVKGAKAEWNGALYRCRVTDAAGNMVYSKTAKLFVLAVTQHPSSQYLKEGSTAVFRVRATGADLKYQWELKTPGKDKWISVGTIGTDKSKHTIEDVKPVWSRYQYRCRITDAAGKATYSKAAWLSVLSIRENPGFQYVKEGNTAVFKTSATGVGLQFQWQEKVSDDSDWKNCGVTGSNTKTLRVKGRTRRSGYRYRCKVTDGGGNATYSKIARLFVLAVKKNPSDRTAKADETVSFSINAYGGGLTYQWQYKRPGDDDWYNSSQSGNKTRILKVIAKASRNGYRFRCRVRDRKGNTTYSKSAKLTVRIITENPSSKKIKAGDKAVFHVKASGSSLRYSWQVRVSSKGKWKESTAPGHATNTLRVTGTTKNSGCQFRCRVTGEGIGKAVYSKVASLYVLGITQNPSDRFTVPGKAVSFSVKAVGAGVEYQWQVRKPSGEWKKYTGSGNKKSSITVNPTASMNGYQYRCRVRDNAGNVVYSKKAELSVFH